MYRRSIPCPGGHGGPETSDADDLRAELRRFRLIAESSKDLEIWTDPDGCVRFVSDACERITGLSQREVLNTPRLLRDILRPDYRDAFDDHQSIMEAGALAHFCDLCIITTEGVEKWLRFASQRFMDDHGGPLGMRSTASDVTDLKLLEVQLHHRTLHDALTGLANRSLCLDRVARALERSKRREDYHFAVLFIDLDRFKTINESLGPRVGDQLLRGVARRLQAGMRSLDTVARQGGDEFIIILEELTNTQEAIHVARRLREELEQPFTFGEHTVHTSASIGIVVSPAVYDRPDELLRNASLAMQRAKKLGRNRFKVFHARLLEDAQKLVGLENDMRRGVKNDEFFVQYQPIIDLPSSRVTGFEALMRWRHPLKGVVPPSDFIPIAEESGLIIVLGRWILRQACQTVAAWLTAGRPGPAPTIHVNLSAKQLAHPDLVSEVARVLEDTGLPRDVLMLEITESTLMENPEHAVYVLRRLKELGARLSIDDFGTGYSSLSYLQRFPIDALKVDQSFVARIEEHGNREIVKAVLALAASLSLEVVAEGVEEAAQLEALTTLNCRQAQGFLFAMPLDPEDALRTLLERGQS